MTEKIVKLNPKEVERLILEAPDQSAAVAGLYRMAFGAEWDKVAELDGYPKINEFTWASIHKLFCDWHKKQDAAYQKKIMPGGVFFNKGFSAYGGEHLKNWEVELCSYTAK